MESTKDLNNEGDSAEETHTPKLSPFGHLFKLIASWLGFTGLYAMFSVCPFCGQQGCPVGIATAGTVGAFFALCAHDWKRLFLYVRQKYRTRG